MTDNIALGADGQANHTLDVLRKQSTNGDIGPDVTFLPGLKFFADPALELSGTWTSPERQVLDLDVTVNGKGNWAALHLALPLATTRPHGVAGFATRIRADETCIARACLRSGHGQGFKDCFFDKHLLFTSDEASHVDALQLHQHDTIPEESHWRELILFLPTESFRLSLLDLRLFVV